MFLNKEQTLEIIYKDKKKKSIEFKYRFLTKQKWYCLCCGKEIYVSYKQYGINSIFCVECLPKFYKKPTIAQFQYMRILKEKQVALINQNNNA